MSDTQVQYDRLRAQCSGFDDPEDRCPQTPSKAGSPSNCRCYEVRRQIEGSRPDNEMQSRGGWSERLLRAVRRRKP